MRRIGFVSLTQGAGSRFVAANLACFLAQEVHLDPAVLELGRPGLSDALALDRRFAGKPFDPAGGLPNKAAGVNWQVQAPAELQKSGRGETEPLALEPPGWYEQLRLMDRVEGDVVLCLWSGSVPELQQEFLRQMDRTVLVIDPLPSRLLAGWNGSAVPCTDITVINKMNKGVKIRQLQSFLERRPCASVPLVPAEHLYRAEYNGCFPYELEPVRQALKQSLQELWNAIR